MDLDTTVAPEAGANKQPGTEATPIAVIACAATDGALGAAIEGAGAVLSGTVDAIGGLIGGIFSA
jgi:hypothetical protein